MFARASLRVALVVLALALLAPEPAHAQFGGLKKKLQEKAQQALRAEEPDAEEPQLRDPVPSSEIEARGATEMTGEVLDRFIKGVEAERWVIEHRAEAVKRRQEREKCEQELGQDPGFLQTMMNLQMKAAGDPKAMRTLPDSLEAYVTSRCGEKVSVDPDQAAEAASGLTSYAKTKERLIAFILARRRYPEVMDRVASGSFIFSAVEIQAVNERFARLESLLEPELREITGEPGN